VARMLFDPELLDCPLRSTADASEDMNCCMRRSGFALATSQHQGARVITVTLMGPDDVRSMVKISEDTTVRDVATSKYHLFWQTTKRNGTSVIPFTTTVVDGDTVTVESE